MNDRGEKFIEIIQREHPRQDAPPSLVDIWKTSSNLADVTLHSEDDSLHIPAHKIVLVASSFYFRSLFLGHLQEGKPPITNVTLPLPNETLQIGIEAAYLAASGEWGLEDLTERNHNNTERLLHASNYLDMPIVLHYCARKVRKELNVSNSLHILQVARDCGLTSLADEALRLAQSNFIRLLQTPAWGHLAIQEAPLDIIQEVLSSNALNVPSERDVLKAALIWGNANPAQRGPEEVPLLLGQVVRYSTEEIRRQIPALLAEIISSTDTVLCSSIDWGSGTTSGTNIGTNSNSEKGRRNCDDKVGGGGQDTGDNNNNQVGLATLTLDVAALGWQRNYLEPRRVEETTDGASHTLTMDVDNNVDREGRKNSFPPRYFIPRHILVAGGVDGQWRTLRSTEIYDPMYDSWTTGPDLPSSTGFATGGVVGPSAFVVEESTQVSRMVEWNRVSRNWSNDCMACHQFTPRVKPAVAVLDNKLFLLGGRTQPNIVTRSIESYDPVEKRWSALPDCDMLEYRTAHASAVLGGGIYVVGGQNERSVTLGSMEYWDAQSGEWNLCGTSLDNPRKYHGMSALNGRLYCLGGVTYDRKRLETVEAWDPREGGRWNVVGRLPEQMSNFGVGVVGDDVFLVGGMCSSSNRASDGVVCLSTRKMEVRKCAPLWQARSGVCVVAV
jgi:hypothetical protein